MSNGKRVGLVLGILALVVSLVIVVTPVNEMDLECGSVLAPKAQRKGFTSDSQIAGFMLDSFCADKRNERRSTALLFGVPGLVYVVWAVLRPRERVDT
jgi:hypothetical protein